jgi:hypothetical protein
MQRRAKAASALGIVRIVGPAAEASASSSAWTARSDIQGALKALFGQ